MNPSVFETIREQVDMVELARRFTDLKRVGNHTRGRCPVPAHDDSTPSFYVYPDQRAHCFGCKFHGDATDLWAAVKGFPTEIEAALDLCREYGIKPPHRDPEEQQKAEERRLKEAEWEQQARACHSALSKRPEIVEWWKGRGFNEELQKQFLLGANSDGGSAVIPFWNRGRVQGLIRRQLRREPKYLLSTSESFPEGYKPLFIPNATGGDIYLVEGFVDALACSALSLRGVAIGGTGISENQKAELQKFKGSVFIFSDADDEGAKAGRSWVQELYPRALLCPAEYGDGRKDVADLFAAEGENARLILEALKVRAVDALDLALSEAPKGSTRERWRYARDRVLPLLLRLSDRGERNAAVEDAAKALGLKASDLRSELTPEVQADDKRSNDSTKLELLDPEAWPDPVDGAQLLDELVRTTRRFVVAPDGAHEAVALWSLHAHACDAFGISPLLGISSPEKRCGKTTLLILVGAYVPRPLPTGNITSSALFRAVEKYRPTLLIDEADTFLAGNEELRGILNSGHRRAGAYVVRTVGDEHEPRLFSTWSPKAIALIGTMPDTLDDRAIPIRMQRRRAGEETEELRLDRLSELEHLRRRAARWAADNLDLLKAADPVLPSGITNARARDNWRVLIAVADAAGGRWPALAREVALKFSSTEPEVESVRVLLLRDLYVLFKERGDQLESEVIVQALIEIEGRPWAEGRNGRPLTKTGLANILRPFKIQPKKWRQGDKTLRGYHRSDFDEVFARYLQSEPPQTPHVSESTTYEPDETPQGGRSVAVNDDAKSNGCNDVAFVAAQDCHVEGENGYGETDESDAAFIECMDFFSQMAREEAERRVWEGYE